MPPATMSGSHAALGAPRGEAPNFLAEPKRESPNENPRLTNDAPRPQAIESISPLFIDLDLAAGPKPAVVMASRRRPATAQIATPAITRITPATIPQPTGVNSFSGCSLTNGSKLPTAAEMPRTMENVSAMPIASTASPKNTCATPQPAPNAATTSTGPGPASR